MNNNDNQKPSRWRLRLPDIVMLLFFAAFGGYHVLFGIRREAPYLEHYKGMPYLRCPAEDILFGAIIAVLAILIGWRYMRRRKSD